ncbi:hypothetical protein A0H81_06360 [Grifola frondosa]|uniref:Uncharacterized protein n=1 Tax=Grifola frondosa TaxID=5627 RepID=A0A1C7MBH9_GRIFR|nr:hypothetical protein A0H81_06360 [Grifola frondosa]
MPSQSDLIQFMMQGPHMGLPVTSQFTTQQGGQWYDQSQGWNYSQQSQPNRGAWRGGFNDRGRGGGHGSYGNSRNAGYTGGRGFEQQDTDAITLAGEDPGDEDTSSASWQISADTQLRNGQSEVRHPESSVGGQGRMQKVGEKWVFVRASEAA